MDNEKHYNTKMRRIFHIKIGFTGVEIKIKIVLKENPLGVSKSAPSQHLFRERIKSICKLSHLKT